MFANLAYPWMVSLFEFLSIFSVGKILCEHGHPQGESGLLQHEKPLPMLGSSGASVGRKVAKDDMPTEKFKGGVIINCSPKI